MFSGISSVFFFVFFHLYGLENPSLLDDLHHVV